MSNEVEVVFITVNGVRLRVAHRKAISLAATETNAAPLLFLNGIGAQLELALPFLDLLERPFIVADMPGVGGSELPKKLLRFADVATMMEQLVRDLGYQHAHVLGYSWGGALAQQYAYQHKIKALSLTLVSTGTGMLMIPAKPWSYLKFLKPSSFMAQVDQKVMKQMRDHLRAIQRKTGQYARFNRAGFLYQLAVGAGWTSVHWLHKVQAQSLVIAGDADDIVPLANAKLIASRLPHATLHVVPNEGHMVLMNQAERLAELIEAHCQQVEAGR